MTSIDEYKLVNLLFSEMHLQKSLPSYEPYGFFVLNYELRPHNGSDFHTHTPFCNKTIQR